MFSPLGEDRFALGLETIYEGYLVHYGSPRLFAPPDADTALLLGDYLYAHGLVRIASNGAVDARRRPLGADLALLAAARRETQPATDRSGLRPRRCSAPAGSTRLARHCASAAMRARSIRPPGSRRRRGRRARAGCARRNASGRRVTTAIREERKVLTALFVDVVGSTSLGERLDPEDVKLVVGEAVTRIVGEIEALGGTGEGSRR